MTAFDFSAFDRAPQPKLLHRLVQGKLSSSMSRALRLWIILGKLYKEQVLPDPFRYPDLRNALFAVTHPTSDTMHADKLGVYCTDRTCICHKPLRHWIDLTPDWITEIIALTGFTEAELDAQLQVQPFATVHRSIRADLEKLGEMGWLHSLGRGRYACLSRDRLPQLPRDDSQWVASNLTPNQRLELLRALETISVIYPNLETVIEPLSQQVETSIQPPAQRTSLVQRIHFDLAYILPDEVRDRVDDYQAQLEELWSTADGGVVQFTYWYPSKSAAQDLSPLPPISHASAKRGLKREQRKVTVYPVCLYYIRRAKYLSAYGKDPEGVIGWHNYRLDRIVSTCLQVLPWGDRVVPKELKQMRDQGRLPTPEYVKQELDKAWGFTFYVPAQLAILRFSEDFAYWYVDKTLRHPTFQRIGYDQLPEAICQAITDPAEQEEVLAILQQRSPADAYYRCWIRPGDVNLIQRLREWRPHGEAIAPLSLRHQMAAEAAQELGHYCPSSYGKLE